MNAEIEKLFEQLESANESAQEEAVLFLCLLLEKQTSKAPSDPLYRVILPAEILQLQMTLEETKSLIDRIRVSTASESLPLSKRTSLIGALGKLCQLEALRTILQFLVKHCDSLNEESAYLVVVSITPMYFPLNQHDVIKDLLREFQTVSHLERLAKSHSIRLEEPVRELLASMEMLGAHTRRTKRQSQIMNEGEEIRTRFVELLNDLTSHGKAEWARSEHEIGFVYCMAGDEFIIFEVRGKEDGRLLDPANAPAGMVSICRNVSYLWLECSQSWSGLLELLRAAPLDHQKFIQFRRRAHTIPIKALESLACVRS